MANLLSLALKINTDASGLKLDPVERALQRLGEETDKVSGIFDKFTGTSEAAAKAQQETSKALEDLITARREGTVTAQEFADAFEKIRDAATAEAAALQRAAQITEANLTPLQRYDNALAELNEQLQAGRISQETYDRATQGAAKGLTDAERAARGLAVQQVEIDKAATNTTLKFNELSGVFSILPGPLGDIAGRISGISSASEGLSRVFGGGLKQGISNLASSFTSLLTPTNLAAAGIAGLGAAATAITRGLVDLEARVKSLGDAADQLGVSFESIQVLEEAAARAGTSLDGVTSGLQKFAARLDDARSGTGAAAEAFRELGISQEELANTAPTELAARVAQELGKIEDPARRAALQVDLLGKSGEELRRAFSEIPEATADLEKFGATISDEDRARIESLGPAFAGFGVALRGLGQSTITPFAGIVAGLTKTLGSLINVVTAVAQAIGTVLGPVLDAVGAAFGLFADGINNTVNFFRSFFASTEEATGKVAALRDATEEATEFDDTAAKAFEKTLEDVRGALSDAVDESAKFGKAGFDAALQYQTAIDELQRQFDNGILNEESFRREAERANEAYTAQIETIKQAAAETEAITKRVDGLLAKANQIPQAQQDLNDLQAEIARVEAKLAEARTAGQNQQADALAARLAQLDQLQAQLEQQADEAAQGFSDGFDKAFENVDKGIGSLIDKAGEFGNEGAIAASQLTEGIEAAKDAVKDGILNQEAFENEVDRQKKLFEERVSDLREAAKITEQLYEKESELLSKQFEIEKERAEELASIRTGAIEVRDIRDGGLSQLFDTLKEDPAVAEAKKQRAELEKIRKEISQLNAQKVDILAGTG